MRNYKPSWVIHEENRLNTQEHNKLVQQTNRLQSLNMVLVEACQLALKAICSGSSYHDGGKLANDAVPALEAALKKAEAV